MTIGSIGQEILREALLVPAVVAATAAIGLGWLLRERTLPVALAIVAGFLVAFELIKGIEPVWPRAASDKLPLIALLGLVGTLAAARRPSPVVALALVIGGAVGLIAWRPIVDGEVLRPLMVAAAGLAVWQVVRRSGGPPWRRHWTLAAIAFALACVALFARTISIAELALACSAALLASAVRPAATVDALLPALALLLGIATTLALFSAAPTVALAISGAIAAAGWASLRVARYLPLPEPVLFVGLGIAAAALAAGWTRWVEGPPLYYG